MKQITKTLDAIEGFIQRYPRVFELIKKGFVFLVLNGLWG
jgi:hypothetical protein